MGLIPTTLKTFDSTDFNRINCVVLHNNLIWLGNEDGEVLSYNRRTNIVANRVLLSITTMQDVVDLLVTPKVTNNANIAGNALFAIVTDSTGELWSYDNDGTWTELSGAMNTPFMMEFYNGNIYIADQNGNIKKWDGVALTTDLNTADSMQSVYAYDGLLFAGNTNQDIYRFDGVTWTQEQQLVGAGLTQIRNFREYNGNLYACCNGTSGSGKHLWKRDDGAQTWTDVLSLNTTSVRALETFKGVLYHGYFVTGDADINIYDGDVAIKLVAAGGTLIGYQQNSFFASGDRLYIGRTGGVNDDALLTVLEEECSGAINISDASPIGWTVGDCILQPSIDDTSDICFTEVRKIGDIAYIQIQILTDNLAPKLKLRNTSGQVLSITNFTNIDSRTWEAGIEFRYTGDMDLIITNSSDATLATSNIILVEDSPSSTVVIKYTNDTDFADMDYSVSLINEIRISAHFWKPVNPQTKSIYEQSTGDVINLKSTVKKGFILETNYMPEYMQRKLSLIFAHSGIEINGVTYYGDEAGIEFELIEGFLQAKGKITLKQSTLLNENII